MKHGKATVWSGRAKPTPAALVMAKPRTCEAEGIHKSGEDMTRKRRAMHVVYEVCMANNLIHDKRSTKAKYKILLISTFIISYINFISTFSEREGPFGFKICLIGCVGLFLHFLFMRFAHIVHGAFARRFWVWNSVPMHAKRVLGLA